MLQQMSRDFPAIDCYAELVKRIDQTEGDDMTAEDLQIVPQDQVPSKLSEIIDNYFGYYQPLLSDPSVGRTTITEVADQEVTAGSSPTHMMELDSYPTLYDSPEMDAKQLAQGYYAGIEEGDLALMEEGLALLTSLATKDIASECVTLNVEPDPKSWSVDDVSKWVSYMSSKYEIKDVSKELMQIGIDGDALCHLADEKSEICSDKIYAQLEIWWDHYKLRDVPYQRNIPTVATADPIQGWENCWLPGSPWGKHVDLPKLMNTFPSNLGVPTPPRFSLGSSDSPESPESSSTDSCQSSSMDSPPRHSPDLEESVHAYRKLIKSSEIKTEPTSPKPAQHKQTIHLWQFLKELLHNDSFRTCIRWINRESGIFKIEDSSRVAKEWGRRKNRPAMNYDKLSRSIRQYYKKGIIKKTENSKRLVYQFCPGYL